MKPPVLQEVLWRDIHSLGSWSSLQEAKEWAKKVYNTPMTSVGYIIEKNKNYLVIAATHDGDEEWNDISMIPTSCVISIKKWLKR